MVLYTRLWHLGIQSYFRSMDVAAIRRYMLALCRSVSELHKQGFSHRYICLPGITC